MSFPSNALEVALAEARDNTVATERRLLEAVADNTLWVPLPDGDGQPAIMADGKGRPHVVAFTSAEQFARGAGEAAHRQVTGRQLAESVPVELGFALNLGAEGGRPVNAAGVQVIRDGGRVEPRLLIGDPAEEPVALLEELSQRFRAVPAVLDARRVLVKAAGQQSRLLIGVTVDPALDARPGDLRRLTAGMPLDVMILDDEDDPVTTWLLTRTEPFYQRS